jgi:hypothetical protein
LSGKATGTTWTPEQIGRLTMTQLLCLLNETPTGEAGTMSSLTEWEAWQAQREAEREAEARQWRGEG